MEPVQLPVLIVLIRGASNPFHFVRTHNVRVRCCVDELCVYDDLFQCGCLRHVSLYDVVERRCIAPSIYTPPSQELVESIHESIISAEARGIRCTTLARICRLAFFCRRHAAIDAPRAQCRMRDVASNTTLAVPHLPRGRRGSRGRSTVAWRPSWPPPTGFGCSIQRQS